MKICLTGLIIVSVLLSSSCQASSSITGTVIDAETNRPIEGVVVLVEWTKTEGVPGMTSTRSYKVVETVTDKDGKFTVENVRKMFIGSPDVTAYKKGYVAWNSRIIFPSYDRRNDFKWSNGYIYKLEPFDEKKYTYNTHVSFIHSAIKLGLGDKKIIMKAIEWEANRAFEERQATRNK